MKVQIASDLHHEMASGALAHPIQRAADADVLVLAGDIAYGTQAIGMYADYVIPVIYVHGNHEACGQDYPVLLDDMRRHAKGTAVRFLQNEQVALNGVRFLGTCMWTDYCFYPLDLADAMNVIHTSQIERRRTGRMAGRFFQPDDVPSHQRETLQWLGARLREPFHGRTVVVTHHAPSGMSIPQKERARVLAAADATNVECLVVRADLWIHGHIHASSDYRIGDCRVICNPRGGVVRNRTRPEILHENAMFNPALLVEL
jgi:predicted phosphodiesterase